MPVSNNQQNECLMAQSLDAHFFMTKEELKRKYECLYNLPFYKIPLTCLPHGFNSLDEVVPGEQWKDIPSYEGLYMASNLGRIKSLPKTHLFGHIIPGRIIKQQFRFDYFYVDLHNKGVSEKHRSVHNIIATTFHEKLSHHECVNHKDGDKLNNCEWNVEWVTESQNHIHALDTGLRKNFGEANHLSKLKENQVEEIFLSKEGTIELSKKYNVHRDTITLIRASKIWRRVTEKIK
jgi:hypothetical protein